MALLTYTDVITRAATRDDIDLTGLSNGEITVLIDVAQKYIEEVTGRVFDVQTKEEQFFNLRGGSTIFLKYYPVLSVTSIKINDTLISSGKYKFNKNDGILYMKHHTFFDDDATVIYTTGYNPTHPTIKEICMALVFGLILASADGKDVKQFDDGDFLVNYSKENKYEIMLLSFKRFSFGRI